MKSELIHSLTDTFEAHAQQAENGIEFWLARDLQYLLGYDEWRNFTTVISKAKTSCELSGHPIADHFVDVNKTIAMPKGAEKEVPDLMLTRYACYLVAQNGDPRKQQIAFAQTYFAMQTRKAEQIEQKLLEAERISARKKLRAVMDEIFGVENNVSCIVFAKTSSTTGDFLGPTFDYLLWYAKRKEAIKYHKVLLKKAPGQRGGTGYKSVQMPDLSRRPLSKAEIEAQDMLPADARIYFRDNLTSQSVGRDKGEGAASWFGVNFEGRVIKPSLSVRWKTNEKGFDRLLKSYRVEASSGNNLGYIRFLEDYPVFELTDIWTDTLGQNQFGGSKTYVVQTALSAIERSF